MRVFALVMCLALLGGCKKRTAPEFYDLESRATVMVARDGDEAYDTPELNAIETGLAAIPEGTLERPKADTLLARLRSEKARVLAERAAQAAPRVSPPPVFPETTPTPTPPPPPEEPTEPVDAGPAPLPVPRPGMTEAEFLAAFGDCMQPGPAATVMGEAGTTQVVRDTKACVKRFGQPNVRVSFVFLKGKLSGTQSEAPDVVTVLDAGMIQPPAPPQPDQTPIMVPFGAPPPPGTEPVPGSVNSR